jgi:hypothetical protein
MDDATLIRKVRDEHRILDEIRDALETALADGDMGDRRHWLATVRERFEHFRAHLIHRIALEEIGGFLNMVTDRRPTLSQQVEHLREAHHEMIKMAEDTLRQLRELDSRDRNSVTQATLLVKMMLSEVRYHEEAEQLLVSYVMNEEIGGSGD